MTSIIKYLIWVCCFNTQDNALSEIKIVPCGCPLTYNRLRANYLWLEKKHADLIWLTIDGAKPTNDCWQSLHESFSQYHHCWTDQSVTDQTYTSSTDKHYSLDSERWLRLRLSKCHSPATFFFFRTTFTQTIALYELLIILGSKQLLRKRRFAIAKNAANSAVLEGRKNIPLFFTRWSILHHNLLLLGAIWGKQKRNTVS